MYDDADQRAAALAALDQALAGAALTGTAQVPVLRLRARDATTITLVAELLQATRTAEAAAWPDCAPRADAEPEPVTGLARDIQTFRVELGRRIAGLRARQGVSQAELAARAGVTRNFLGAIERGTQNLDAWRLRRLAQALQVPSAVLLGEVPMPGRTEAVASARVVCDRPGVGRGVVV